MKKIELTKEIKITEPGSYQLEISSSGDFSITLAENVKSSLFIDCLSGEQVNVNIHALAYSQSSIIVWNHNEHNMICEDTINLEEGASCHIAYAELASSDLNRKCIANLTSPDASIQLHTATLSAENKQYDIVCHHQSKITSSLMKNFIVLLEHGKCTMVATGKIDKGASGSKSHQTSRCLTFDQQQRANVTPQLLIEENDVEASHAMTLGQIDENQLYYLQSRGLSQKEVTKLITIGYLLPIADEIEDEELKQRCIEEIEKRVHEICLI